jgi:hypothetical protein
MPGRIESCIRNRPGIAMFRRVNASIAGLMSQASHRSRFTPTTAMDRLVVRDRRFVEVILCQKYNAIPLELAALFREKTSLAPEFGAHHLFSSSVSGAPGLTSGHGVEFLGHERYLD